MSTVEGADAELCILCSQPQTAALAAGVPAGWRREMRARQNGRTAGRVDVYMIRWVTGFHMQLSV